MNRNYVRWFFMYTEMWAGPHDLTLGRICGWPRVKVAVIECGAAL